MAQRGKVTTKNLTGLKPISKERMLKCAGCDCEYDLICAKVSISHYDNVMTKQNKTNWMCHKCLRPRTRRQAQVDKCSTPVNLGKQLPSLANSQKKIFTPSDQAPLSTTHINTSLSDMEEDHSIPFPGFPNSTLRGSVSELSKSDHLAKSLPDLSTLTNTDIDDFKKENELLKEQLHIAHTEIENLHSEKNDLQKQNLEQQKLIAQLKLICKSSPYKSNKTSSITKHGSKFFNKSLDYTNINTTNTESSVESRLPNEEILKKSPKKTYAETVSDTKDIAEGSKKSKTSNMRQIRIYGTQQCVGLASAITQSRQNSKYENYSVTATTKPNATTEEVLKSCQDINLETRDKVVICVGENDNNPVKVISELYVVLKKYYMYTVIVLNILSNKYLNENRLNNDIQMLCKNFNNCVYVKSSHQESGPRTNNTNRLKYMCDQVNYVIDCEDYDHKYLNFKSQKKYSQKKTCSSSTRNCNGSLNNINSQKISNKGIIPYYFAPIKKNSVLPLKPIQNKRLVKTLITDYFSKQLKHVDTTSTNDINSEKKQFFR